MIHINKLLCATMIFVSIHSFGQNHTEEIERFREEYKEEFLKSNISPVKKEDFQYLRFFEPDESFRVKGSFKSVKGGKPFQIPTTSGQTQTHVRFGEITFQLGGKEYKLMVYRSPDLQRLPQYRDYLFIPFKDQTNGKETYGGGRYIDLRMKQIENDSIILDFNKAYNPYCAFAAGYSCPIPPRENHLKVAINAGEKTYAKN